MVAPVFRFGTIIDVFEFNPKATTELFDIFNFTMVRKFLRFDYNRQPPAKTETFVPKRLNDLFSL
ncbi:MAG: hypothetical protein GY839_12425 [candidate division Zixibacteria bacterium]|nr:hypothetical protein [candidate division Zixibacteria bacterium]